MWGEDAKVEQPPQPAALEQDQVSIMIDQPEGSVSVDQQVQDNDLQQHDDPLPDQQLRPLQQHVLLENPSAIVPYQPHVIQHHEIFIGMARIVAGPPLPPEMIWKRSFQNLMFDFSVKEVPKSIFIMPMGSIIYSKRS